MVNRLGCIDYSKFNYCSCCDQKWPKPMLRCGNFWCKQRLRTLPLIRKKREHVRY